MYSQALTKAIDRGLAKLFGGVRPEMILDAATLAEVERHVKPVKRRAGMRSLFLLVLLSCVTIGPLIWLRIHLDGAAVHPVLDQRRVWVPMFLAIGGFFLILVPIAWLELALTERSVPLSEGLWRDYYATTTGWLPHRRGLLLTVFGVCLFLPMAMWGWNGGDRVDNRGIAYSHGFWGRATQSYSSVTRVEYIEAKRTSVVKFKDGDVWEYRSGNSGWTPSRSVAETVAARAGVPVQTGNARP